MKLCCRDNLISCYRFTLHMVKLLVNIFTRWSSLQLVTFLAFNKFCPNISIWDDPFSFGSCFTTDYLLRLRSKTNVYIHLSSCYHFCYSDMEAIDYFFSRVIISLNSYGWIYRNSITRVLLAIISLCFSFWLWILKLVQNFLIVVVFCGL